MNKSAVPISHGYPNPYYERVVRLLNQQDELKNIVGLVKKIGEKHRGPHGYDIAAVMSEFKRQQPSAVNRLSETYRTMQTGHTLPTMGPPPRPCDLYGRFGAGLEVLDIGSGNCSKLSSFTGVLKITVCDTEELDTPHVVRKLRGGIHENLDILRSETIILSTFMSLTQLPPVSVGLIMECDGLHLIPDHAVLLQSGVARMEGDKVLVRTVKQVFHDNAIQMPGYSPRVGYKLCPTFKTREICVQFAPEISQGEPCQIDATPEGIEDIAYDDVSYKYDGVPYELEIKSREAYITDRAGLTRVGFADFGDHICLHLEQVVDRYVLIRVLAYRGIIPPHHGDVLRLFATKVKISIDGLPVVGPEKWDPRKVPALPIDGLISRRHERDYYHKTTWTVDIYGEAGKKYSRALNSRGFVLDADFKPGLWEYSMHRNEQTVVLRPLKPRVDKIESTSEDTVLYLLGKKTLSEMEALTGTPWLI